MEEVRALVLSGGGSKGSYQAGVVDYLLRVLGRRYAIHAGVSVGAINSVWLAHFRDGEEQEAACGLVQFWQGISTDKVRKRWFFGDLSVLWKPSRYNSEPLRKYLAARLDPERVRKSRKRLFVGAVSLDSGRFEAFTEQAGSMLLDAVLASASYPAMLLPIKLAGELWTDGGVRDVTPLATAIDAGATVVDVVMCTPRDKRYSELRDPNALDVLERAVSIMTDEVIETDIALARAYNQIAKHEPNGKRRHVEINVIRPSEGLGVSSLNFDPEDMARLLEQGRADAQEQAH